MNYRSVVLLMILMVGCKTAETGDSSSAAKDVVVETGEAGETHRISIEGEQAVYSKCRGIGRGGSPLCVPVNSLALREFRVAWDKAFLKGETRAITSVEKRSRAAVERRLRSADDYKYNKDIDQASVRMRPWIAALPEAMGQSIGVGGDDTPAEELSCDVLSRLACIEGSPEIACQARRKSDNELFGTAPAQLAWCPPKIRLMKNICAAGKKPSDYSIYCYDRNNTPPATPDRASMPVCNISWPRCLERDRAATCDASPRRNPGLKSLTVASKYSCAPHLHAVDELCNHGVDPNKFRIDCIEHTPSECQSDARVIRCQSGYEIDTDGCPAGKARGCRPVAAAIEEQTVAESYTKTAVNGGINPDYAGFEIKAKVMVGSNSCFASGWTPTLKVDVQHLAMDGGPKIYKLIPLLTANNAEVVNRMCPMNYAPVFKTVSATVRYSQRNDRVILLNYKERGTEEVIYARQQ